MEGCKGSNCRAKEGMIKLLKEVERGLESKYKNQYDTQIGEGTQNACPENADRKELGAEKEENILDHIAVY
jgi:hypothetical protein